MRVHQGQLTGTEGALDPTRFSRGGWILWMWLARSLSKKPLTMTLGLVSSAYSGFLEIQSVWILTFLDLEGRGRNLNYPQGRKPWLLLGMEREEEREWGEWEGVGRRGENGNVYILINFEKKKSGMWKVFGGHIIWRRRRGRIKNAKDDGKSHRETMLSVPLKTQM